MDYMVGGTSTMDAFRLDGRVIVVTGGAGVLGRQHARAIADAGGIPVLWDVDEARAKETAEEIRDVTHGGCESAKVDVTSRAAIAAATDDLISRFGRIDGLINNAANDPKMGGVVAAAARFETYPESSWDADMAVGLKGAFFCSQAIGTAMAAVSRGVILNIASDLGLIGPDQRVYQEPGRPSAEQPTKPVTYSVIKHGLIGLTRFLATYWADRNVRANALSPGGIYVGQSDAFVERLTNLIPMGRMARGGEYQAAVLFLLSDASSYVTGANLSIDGGRTCW